MTGHASAVAAASEVHAEAHFTYHLFGLRFRSAVPLAHMPMLRNAGVAPADCVFRLAPAGTRPEPVGRLVASLACDGACHGGADAARVYRGAAGTWFWHDRISTTHVWPGARRVDVYPEVGADPRALAQVLLGPVATLVLHQLGFPCLQASAVQLGSTAVAFLGPPGRGKSTIAALLLRRGATLLSDDILPLRLTDDGVYGVPSVPMMRLDPETLAPALGVVESLPRVAPAHRKRVLALHDRYPFAEQPVRLRAVYLLERFDPLASGRNHPVIRRLSGRDGLTALLAHTCNSALLEPAENALLLPLYSRVLAQAGPAVLSYPHGLRYQDALLAEVGADLDARP